MGACLNAKDLDNEEDAEEFKRNRRIETQIRAQNKNDLKIRLLLLGTGDSGKSTFVKQMKVSYKNGFSHTELVYYQNVVRTNCIQAMQKALDYTDANKTSLKDKLTESTGMAFENIVSLVMNGKEMTDDVADILVKLWQNKDFKNYLTDNCDNMQIPATTPYFFDNIDRISKESYKPNQDDILRAKLKTTGISEVKFVVGDTEFTLVDVGGQRAERRKWLHCFDGINGVIYLAALDEYNMTLQEDHNVNRLDESLRLFQEVSSSQRFNGKSFIIFLNKSDIFEEKIKKYPLHKTFPNVEKENVSTLEKSIAYISQKYEDQYGGSTKLYIYVTNALDAENSKRVFDSVRDGVIQESLKYAGFS
jgi:GTPase SAR1 family protein